MGTYLTHFGPRLGEEGFDVPALSARLRPAPEARELLLRFVRQHAALQEAA